MVIAFGVFIAIVFLVGGPLLVYFHQTYPCLRASMVLGKDLFVAFFTVVGIFIAAENLRRTALSARSSVAFRLVERWNDPKMAEFWSRWHKLYAELREKSAPDVVAKVADNNQSTAADVLNFMEEIAIAVNAKAADDRQIWTSLGPTILEYFDTLTPWVKDYRLNRNRPHAWVAIEKLVDHWTRPHGSLHSLIRNLPFLTSSR